MKIENIISKYKKKIDRRMETVSDYKESHDPELLNSIPVYEKEIAEIGLILSGLNLAKAEAEGRLIILPCKVGDILELRVMGTVQKYRFMGIIQQEGYLPSLYGRQLFGKFQDVPIAMVESFGKTVFLTREAAENALGGGEDGSSKDE